MFAHSLPDDQDRSKWEPLTEHLYAVGASAAANAAAFGASSLGQTAGLLHDIGKCSVEFQEYIAGSGSSPDHSTAGAVVASHRYGKIFGRLLAFAIAGHHAGLPDGADSLASRLAGVDRLPDFSGWEQYTGALPDIAALKPTAAFKTSPEDGFAMAFLTRMVFSALVDADFLATEAFYAKAQGEAIVRGAFLSLLELRDRLRCVTSKRAADSPVNAPKYWTMRWAWRRLRPACSL